jgi:plasmid stability protein
MSTSITIRNVPEDTHAELASRAALAGQSLQEYLRGHLIALAAKPDMMTLMARIHERKERTGTNVRIETILADLDAERQ